MKTNTSAASRTWNILFALIPMMVISIGSAAMGPGVVSVSPANGATDAKISTQVIVTFNTAMNPATINASTFELLGSGNTIVAARVSYDPVLRQAMLTPLAMSLNPATYTVIVMGGKKGVKDLAGNTMNNDYVWSFKKKPDDATPNVKFTEPANGSTGININTQIDVKFTEDMDPATITTSTFQLLDATNQIVPATVTYHASPQKATLTPLSPLANSAAYTGKLVGGTTGVKDLAGNPLAGDYTWSFSTSFTIFQPTDAPLNPVIIDQPVEVGVKFTTTQDGKIQGLRFFKGAGNDGTHIGHLWTSSGIMLAEATFVNETASGWQQALFSGPVAITAGQVYLASYFTSSGKYGFTNGYFATSVVNGPIRALANGESGGNGVFTYSAVPAFPISTFNATNYFVDVLFAPNPSSARVNVNNNVVSVPDASLADRVASTVKLYEREKGLFEVKPLPNPSSDDFRVYLNGSAANPVSIRVTDVSGRLIEMHQQLTSVGVLYLGRAWKSGVYFAEVIQGNQRRVVKLIKAN